MAATNTERGGAGGSAGDRLSDLPDCLLHSVLSFLPAQQVVQTCVLSKRWTDLWRTARCINLDVHGFRSAAPDSRDARREKWEKMEGFTTNLLMSHSSPTLDAFRLNLVLAERDSRGRRHADIWIRRGIKYRPSVLEIRTATSRDDPYELPHLGACSRRLKRLHLSRLTLDSRFAEQIRSECPVLEDLDLEGCHNGFHGITSNTLKNLVVLDCTTSSGTGDMLVITAPGLASLRVRIISMYPSSNGVSLVGMNSLVKATISVTYFVTPNESVCLRHKAMLLGSLFNATSLELTGFQAMVMLDKELDKFQTFGNLKTLSLERCLLDESDANDKLKAIGRFLQKAPHLEKLTLQNCWLSEDSTMTERNANTSGLSLRSPNQNTFQCQKLKMIEIKYKGDIDGDHQLFQLMWAICRNLQKATIVFTPINIPVVGTGGSFTIST